MFGKLSVILGLVGVLLERYAYQDGELFWMGIIMIAVGAFIMSDKKLPDELK